MEITGQEFVCLWIEILSNINFITGPNLNLTLSGMCRNARQRVILVSPYIKVLGFNYFAQSVNGEVVSQKKLITSWNKQDLVSGVSDLGVYPLARKQGWSLHHLPNLHAKSYIADQEVLVGSPNLTGSGFSLVKREANVEAAMFVPVDYRLEEWINKLFDSSIEITDDLFCQIKKEVSETSCQAYQSSQFSNELLEKLQINEGYSLSLDDLFWTDSPSKLVGKGLGKFSNESISHDCGLLNLSCPANLKALKRGFIATKCWAWLEKTASNKRTFGELTARLHAQIGRSSRVRRKVVKHLLQNLLSWSEYLCPERIKLDSSNHSMLIEVR